MKDIIEPLAFIAKREAAQCKGCYGRGEKGAGTFATEYARDMGYPPKPCPNCAELRKIAEMEWIDCKVQAKYFRNFKTPPPISETPTITQVAGMMKTCGVWERFCKYLKIVVMQTKKPEDDVYINFANIFTSDEFYPVVAEFLRKEVAG